MRKLVIDQRRNSPIGLTNNQRGMKKIPLIAVSLYISKTIRKRAATIDDYFHCVRILIIC
ncbi:hypothetical protein [Lysinibacillus sphaericus]|uniref:hypothetical protein n=1 Tax=Lysinibacillus sphaericus TaxID=1421 RepID=UPI003D026D4F